MREPEELLDERVLRRALRLEADEPRPRFDAAGIAALAASGGPSRGVIAAGLVLGVATGLTAGAVWSALIERGPAVGSVLVGAALDAVIAVATFLVPLAEAAQQPAVPLSLVAALGIAILHELRERREHLHVHAS